MNAQTPEQLGDALANAIHAPDSKLAKLTETVKVVDGNGIETGQTKARFILKPTAYLGMPILQDPSLFDKPYSSLDTQTSKHTSRLDWHSLHLRRTFRPSTRKRT